MTYPGQVKVTVIRETTSGKCGKISLKSHQETINQPANAPPVKGPKMGIQL